MLKSLKIKFVLFLGRVSIPIKYSHLPRKVSLTLTWTVRVIVNQFLPDMHQDYVFQNFKQLDLYHLPSSAVSHYLQRRPPTVVKHCLVPKTKSSRYTKDEVVWIQSFGVFHVMKDAKKRTVNFRRHDDSMVGCSCKDSKKWRILCKHFYSISLGIWLELEWTTTGIYTKLLLVYRYYGHIVHRRVFCYTRSLWYW